MAPTTHREIERKLRIPEGFALPGLAALADAVMPSGAPHEAVAGAPIALEAEYFDTEQLSLIRWGVTLRRRTGGSDEGWHCKLPVGLASDAPARDEIRMPLSASAAAVPPELGDIVAPLARGLRLEPVATVGNHRVPWVIASAGIPLVELVSDDVRVRSGSAEVAAYRELEIEAIDPASERALALMDALADALEGMGAQRSSVSKAAAALGIRAGQPADIPALPLPPAPLAVDVLRSTLAEHARHLLMADVAVRRDLPDAVHQMRVACRRLRSTLKTFGPVLDPAWASALREELAWLASELGAIRDTEVLLERLDGIFDELDAPFARLAHEAVDPWLRQRLVSARSGALAALRSDRHDWLVDDLVDAVASPGVTDAAFVPAAQVLPALLHESWKRLRKRGDALMFETPAETWHEARIAAKRARYAAEGLAPVMGPAVAELASALKAVTEVLGDHQDADIACAVLRERAGSVAGDAGFALGLAHERERAFMARQRWAFLDSWHDVRKAAKKAGA